MTVTANSIGGCVQVWLSCHREMEKGRELSAQSPAAASGLGTIP